MDIWLINHYAVPPKYYPLARQTCFARYLMAMGHTVTIFAASTVHNSNMNLITDGAPWRDEVVDGVHYVYIRCMDYQGNGLKRIYNICEFAWKLPGVCRKFPRPDAIVATSMPPTSCAMGIHLARKYGCRGVAEIRCRVMSRCSRVRGPTASGVMACSMAAWAWATSRFWISSSSPRPFTRHST